MLEFSRDSMLPEYIHVRMEATTPIDLSPYRDGKSVYDLFITSATIYENKYTVENLISQLLTQLKIKDPVYGYAMNQLVNYLHIMATHFKLPPTIINKP